VAIENQEEKELQEEDNVLAKITLRPKTPPYKEFVRIEDKERYQREDKKKRAIILLQRLLRGRAK
jgi:hypothetical protein